MQRERHVIKVLGWQPDTVTLPNAFCQDHTIPPVTRSVLLDLFSRPHDWEISVSGIMASQHIGRDAARAALKKAEEAGYAISIREKGENGKFGTVRWFVCASKERLAEYRRELEAGNLPEPEKPAPAEPAPVNPTQQLKRRNNIKDNTTKPSSSLRSEEAVPAHKPHRLSFASLKSDPPPKRQKRKRTALPEDWKPSAETIVWARKELGAHPQNLQLECLKFSANARAKGMKLLDWDQAFRSWLISASQYRDLTRSAPTVRPEPEDEVVDLSHIYAVPPQHPLRPAWATGS